MFFKYFLFYAFISFCLNANEQTISCHEGEFVLKENNTLNCISNETVFGTGNNTTVVPYCQKYKTNKQCEQCVSPYEMKNGYCIMKARGLTPVIFIYLLLLIIFGIVFLIKIKPIVSQ